MKTSISVVMASCNGGCYIEEQVRSIFRQSLLPDELLVQDDASSDQTLEILRKLQASAPFTFRIETNRNRLGYAENFRTAVRKANGGLIFLCDQDDVWLPHKIRTIYETMEKYPEILSLASGYYLTSEDLERKRASGLFAFHRPHKVHWKSFLRHPRYPGMALAFRRSVFDEADQELWPDRAAHDWMINQTAARQDGLYEIGERLVLYRQHKDNTAGVVGDFTGETALRKRIGLFEELIDELRSIREEGCPDFPYVRKLLTFQEKRKLLLSGRKFKSLLCYELANLDCVSARSLCGDLLTALRSRR